MYPAAAAHIPGRCNQPRPLCRTQLYRTTRARQCYASPCQGQRRHTLAIPETTHSSKRAFWLICICPALEPSAKFWLLPLFSLLHMPGSTIWEGTSGTSPYNDRNGHQIGGRGEGLRAARLDSGVKRRVPCALPGAPSQPLSTAAAPAALADAAHSHSLLFCCSRCRV